MNLIFSDRAWEEYLHWQATDRKMMLRINHILREITRSPFVGVGKPEPLKHEFKGYWSRRISEEHRIVYKVQGDSVLIAQLRYHY